MHSVIYQVKWFLHCLGDNLINKEPGKEICASEKKFSGFLQAILCPSRTDNHQKNIREEEKQI
jgi:hypothetical protein